MRPRAKEERDQEVVEVGAAILSGVLVGGAVFLAVLAVVHFSGVSSSAGSTLRQLGGVAAVIAGVIRVAVFRGRRGR
ncbi:DUF6332 family protein [Actinacidiphila bryophytorum]|uniref:DUF6332 family protein n=1 Tax=Actinacidiphila bryophytorum TaxID=1436133 RepID=UPI001960850D|nr:DUF6332 family protein [Actinacidiphila bryophytorum]MBM9438442.1 hypothetical protein [Actinacidiphila bryophytorum]MBN6545831.1 hypothetical protein [Actinacidiphila bryophytorum]